MIKARILAFGALLISTAYGADSKWMRMPSADFEIYSSAGEGDTRRVLQYFERVRGFFNDAMGAGVLARKEPVRVIVFGSRKEYDAYRPNEVAVAFYTQVGGRDYIVLSGVNDNVFPVAVHEYVHLVAQNAGLRLPPWLNEGVAEVFSTLKPAGDKILVGDVIPGRMYGLLQDKWVPLAVILAADHDSPYYNERSKAGSLYNEGWALAHMLELSPQYAARFGPFLDEIQKGTPSQKAIESVYGKPLDAVEKDLRGYLRHDTFVARLIPAKLQNGDKAVAEPAAKFDVDLALLDLANRPGREAETQARLRDLIAEDPRRPEPHVALGYLDARGGRQEEATRDFAAAFDLGSRNPRMLWDFGRMAGSSNAPLAMRALGTLLTDEPGRDDVRLVLAQIQLNAKQAQEAMQTLNPIKRISAEDAPRLFQLRAFGYLALGDRSAARANAQLWLANTKEPEGATNANRMLSYLSQSEQPAAAAPAPLPRLTNDEADARPKLVRAVPPPSPAAPEKFSAYPGMPSLAGTLVAFDCSKGQPRFVLQTAGKQIAFLMDDPKSVLITGLHDQAIDMNCGAQTPVAVWIQYEPPPAGVADVTGIARVIHYEPQGSAK